MIILCWTIEPELWLINFLLLSFCSVVPALPAPPCVQTGEGGPHPLASCTGHHTVKVSRRDCCPVAPCCSAWPGHPASPRAHQNWSPQPLIPPEAHTPPKLPHCLCPLLSLTTSTHLTQFPAVLQPPKTPPCAIWIDGLPGQTGALKALTTCLT